MCEKVASVLSHFKMTLGHVAAILIIQCLWCLCHLIALSLPSMEHLSNFWGIHSGGMPWAHICEKVGLVLSHFRMTLGPVAAILIIQCL